MKTANEYQVQIFYLFVVLVLQSLYGVLVLQRVFEMVFYPQLIGVYPCDKTVLATGSSVR